MDASNQTTSTPTYYLDSTTLIALQLSEPFNPAHLTLPRFYQRALEQDPLFSTDSPFDNQSDKMDPGIVRGIVAKINLDDHLDATAISLGNAEFQIQRHLLNPPLNPAELAKIELFEPDTQLPHWTEQLKSNLSRFSSLIQERNRNLDLPSRYTDLAPAEIADHRHKALRLAKELAHHAQAQGDKPFYQEIHSTALLYQEKEINRWLEPTAEQQKETRVILEQAEQARSYLRTLAPEESNTEEAKAALSHLEDARRLSERQKPHRLVWEPYHLLTLLSQNVYVISTNPLCEKAAQLIKSKNVDTTPYSIDPNVLGNLIDITSQKYLLKSVISIRSKTLETKLQRIPTI